MDTKRFLFVSADAALITDLAWQVHREGHDVKCYVEAETDREIGDGERLQALGYLGPKS